MYKVILTFESVNKNMLMKVYLSSIVYYIKLTKKNYHLLGLLQEQEDPENKNKIFLKIQFCFVDWSVLNCTDINFYFNLLSVITVMITMKMMMLYNDAYADDDDNDDDHDDNRSSIEECDDNQWQPMTLTNLNQNFFLFTCTRVMTSVHRWNIRAW